MGPDDFVFPGPDGGVLHHNTFYRRRFKPAVVAAGLPPAIRFRDLRHTCASLCVALGAHPKAIQERLGHSSITVTLDRYGHLFPASGRRGRSGLDTVRRPPVAHRSGIAFVGMSSRPELPGMSTKPWWR